MTKLIKFIMPLGIAVATATPFMVSCSNNIYKYDLTKPFNPTIKPLGGKLNPQQATKIYLDAANKQKQIIADDLANTWYQFGLPSQGYTSLTINSISIDSNESLISIEYTSEGSVSLDSDVVTKEEIKIENIRVKVLYGDQPSFNTNWGMTLDFDQNWLLENDKWHYYQKDTYQTADVIVHDWNKQKLVDDPQQAIDIFTIMMSLELSLPSLSFYLSQTDSE